MNAHYFGDFTGRNKNQMVDFTYYMQNKRSSHRKSIQIFTPKMHLKNEINHNNPQEMFNASNNINLILSKNLVSIYKENKQEITKTLLYKNVNCLLKKNNDSNIYLYNKMINYKNNNNNVKSNINNIYKDKKKSFYISRSDNFMGSSEIINSNKYFNSDSLNRASIKMSEELQKQFENSKNKSEYKTNSHRSGTGLHKYAEDILLKQKKEKKSLFFNNQKSGIKNKTKNYRTDSTLKNNENQQKKLKTENLNSKKRSNSEHAELNLKFNFNNLNNSSYRENKNSFANVSNKNIKSNLNSRRYSLKSNFNFNKFNNNFKLNPNNLNINTNPKGKTPRHSIFVVSPKRNLQIPELKQGNKATTHTLIASQMESIRKELENFEKNEITELMNDIEKNKAEKKKNNNLRRVSMKPNLETKKIDHNDLTRSKLDILEQNENTENQESNALDERFQKKYRKIFLCKNLYDSLDDEEVIEEGKVYNCYLAPNSFVVYVLDTIILISSFIELYYLPIYISYHITAHNIYSTTINTIIFDIIDALYVFDLFSGFFRAYYNFEENLVKKPHYIFLHYLTGWFIFDLIEAIPFFTVLDHQMIKLRDKSFNPFGREENLFNFGLNNKYFSLTFLKLIKIFKIFSNNSALTEIKKYLDNNQFFYEWKGIFYSLLIILSTLHFSTCFFIFIGKNEFQGWILFNNLQDKSFMDIYIASLYYQMTTLTTVGYGDISSTNDLEKFYGIFVLIVGTCAYSWILTNISNYIKKNNEKFIDFEEKMKVLNEIKLEYPNLDQELYNRITRYLNYNKSEYKCNLKFILESLPSSLQNNLIIEIYKPIIKNFQFFKSFENSDFFVKIVTSLKPILTMKDDILIEEGEMIEDIIFIKNGVLTLEIIIDLNDPKTSIESHLETTGMNCFKNISNHKFTVLMNLSSFNTMYRPEFGNKIFNENSNNKKEIKIIDLRKNEHFGDILMILNEKSPLTVKVKSKKAELFFLEKTEAIEISNRYSNIWKRIVNRSLHNMKQIKNLIRKKVLFFSETYNIEINPDLKQRYLKHGNTMINQLLNNSKGKNHKKENNYIETILEEEESFVLTTISEKNFNHQSTKDKSQSINTLEFQHNNSTTKHHNNKKRVVNFKQDFINKTDIELDKKYEKHNSEKIGKKNILKNANKTITFKEEIKEENKNKKSSKNINEIKDEITDNKNDNDKSNKINQINNYNYNINIFAPKVEIPLNQINNIENKTPIKYNKEDNDEINNSSNLGRINSEISFNKDFIIDIKDNNILMKNSDENCNIPCSNIKLKNNDINNNNINDNDKEKYHKNIIELFESKNIAKFLNKKNKQEGTEIKTNDKISIKSKKSVSSDKSKIDLKNKNNENNKINNRTRFNSLSTSSSTSFTLNSSYENINAISNYKYNTDTELREKTKKFILEQINPSPEKKERKISYSHTVKPNNNNNNKFTAIKTNNKLSNKKFSKKNSVIIPNSRKNLNKTISINVKPMIKHSFCEGVDSHFTSHIDEENKDDFFTNINGKKRKSLKNKIRKHISTNEKDNTFYGKINRIKTMKKRNVSSQDEYSDGVTKVTKMNYNQLISQNIEKNQQNLNNPEEYFEGFFNNIIFNNTKANNILSDNTIKKKKTIQKRATE